MFGPGSVAAAPERQRIVRGVLTGVIAHLPDFEQLRRRDEHFGADLHGEVLQPDEVGEGLTTGAVPIYGIAVTVEGRTPEETHELH